MENQTFISELTNLINKYSIENNSNTPDFLLAGFLQQCLQTFVNVVKERDKWYSFNPVDREKTDSQNSAGYLNNSEFIVKIYD